MEEAARTTYEAARQEILHRMRLREHALLVYIAFVGAIFGVVFTEPSNGANGLITSFSNGEALLSIPFFALGVAILVSQHYMMAAAIGQFCTNELEPFVIANHSGKFAPQWDNSKAFKEHAYASAFFRVIGHASLIIIPCIVALGVNWNHAIGNFPLVLAWWFGLICVFGIIYAIHYAHDKRKTIYGKRSWGGASRTTSEKL